MSFLPHPLLIGYHPKKMDQFQFIKVEYICTKSIKKTCAVFYFLRMNKWLKSPLRRNFSFVFIFFFIWRWENMKKKRISPREVNMFQFSSHFHLYSVFFFVHFTQCVPNRLIIFWFMRQLHTHTHIYDESRYPHHTQMNCRLSIFNLRFLIRIWFRTRFRKR